MSKLLKDQSKQMFSDKTTEHIINNVLINMCDLRAQFDDNQFVWRFSEDMGIYIDESNYYPDIVAPKCFADTIVDAVINRTYKRIEQSKYSDTFEY